MNTFLPLFPLQIVVFPGEALNLHIFEPRYRQLINECETEGILFGIPAFIEGRVQEIGTEVELLNIEKRYADGKLDVKTKGVGVFKIEEFLSRVPNKLYGGAKVEKVEDHPKGDILQSKKIVDRIAELFEVMHIHKDIPSAAEFTTFDMGHHVGLSLEQEYELLCINSEEDRQDYMLEHLERLIPVVKEMENLRIRVQMNGHFKNIIPPNV